MQNRSFEEKEPPKGHTAGGNRLRPAPVKNHLNDKVSNETYRWNDEYCPGWALETKGPGKAVMELTKENPLHPATPNSLQISIPKDAGEASLINHGYVGMGLKGGEKYHLRLYLSTAGYNGEVLVHLLSSTDKVLSEAPVQIVKGAGWNEYRLDLVPDQSDTKAWLVLCFRDAGTVWADYVSLFPEKTFNIRPNGLRKDVAEFLAGLKPAFIRWPGGCIVEGITLCNRVEWKKTLGDPMTRSGE